jgi:coenzyme F420-dependent glucose-6-phosphate dehydrogenase
VIAGYRRGAEQAGREPGEIVLQALASWATSDEQALDSSGERKGTLVDEHYTDPVADPAEVGSNGDELSDKTFQSQAIVSADPETHVKRIRTIEKLGATAVGVMNISGHEPVGMLRTYGQSVLPELRSA